MFFRHIVVYIQAIGVRDRPPITQKMKGETYPMKNIKKLLAAMLVIAFVLAAVPAMALGKGESAPAEVSGSTFTNEYITFTVDNYGGISRFYTMENGYTGDELLYGTLSSYGTSYTTVRISGTNYRYDTQGTVVTNPVFQGDTNYSAVNFNGVKVEQRLYPVMNDSGHESIVAWHYTYTNNTDSDQTVGCRIMLDTCLGSYSGDGAAYRIPGVDSITTEQMYIGSEIPPYWFTFYGDIVAQGTFESGNMPNQFQISQWSAIYNNEWNYANTYGYTMSDTSCAATWYEETLAPGETREYVMYYGIGEVAQEQVGQLQLTLNGNHSVALNDAQDGYEPNPVSLMGILANVGYGGLTGVYANVVLPEGLSLVGDNGQFNVGALAAGADDQTTWYINIDSTSTEDRTFVIEVHYGCDGQEEGVAYWELFVPGVPGEPEPDPVPPEIHVDCAELRQRTQADSRADLRFIFFVQFNDSVVEYEGETYGPGEAFHIDSFYATLTANNKSVVVPGNNIYEMYPEDMEPGFTFTAVLKGIKPANFDTAISALGTLEFTELATGEAMTNNTADEPFAATVNGLLN